MQRDLMHTVVYHLYDGWQPKLGNDQVSPATATQLRAAVTAWTVLSCDVADPSLHSLQRFSSYIMEIGWERLVALMKDLKAAFQRLEVPSADFIGLHAPYAEIIRPIRASLILAIRGDARAFINVNAWLAFVTKVHVPNESLEQSALEKWLKAEEDMAPAYEPMVEYLHYLFTKAVPYCEDNFYPHHSSGQTAEGFLDRKRNSPLRPKDRILYDTSSDGILTWSGLSDFCFGQGSSLERTNVLTFVPKSASALRAISMEPTLLQFLQQGLKDILYADFARNPIFRDSIHLFDNGYNRRLAIEGSRTGKWATIDLSSASDTVSNDLVSKAAVGTSWFRPLMGTRSSHTLLPNGERVKLRKFAPMGSAVAFPVECLVFLSAARLAAQEDTSSQWERQHCLVYGDDIIVHQAVAPRLVSILQDAGFTVNQDKSFITGSFRESCGVEAYRGVDITPMYHRVSYLDGTRRLYPGLVAHANEAFSKGFFRLREYYIAEIKRITGRRYIHVPYVVYGEDDSRLWSRCGESAPSGRNAGLQCSTRLELQNVVDEKIVNDDFADEIALQSCLRNLERAKAPWQNGPLLSEGHSHVVSTTSAIAVRRVLLEH